MAEGPLYLGFDLSTQQLKGKLSPISPTDSGRIVDSIDLDD